MRVLCFRVPWLSVPLVEGPLVEGPLVEGSLVQVLVKGSRWLWLVVADSFFEF